MTEYDIQRISSAIVNKLCNDERFIRRMAKLMKQNESRSLVNSTKAAQILGLSRKTVTEIAEYLNGIRGEGESAHWMFPEEGLVDAYIRYKQTRKRKKQITDNNK